MCQNLISDLNAYGVCVLDSFIGEEKGLKILDEVKQMYTAGKFKVIRFLCKPKEMKISQSIKNLINKKILCDLFFRMVS